jgi:hypothetical protein
MGEGKRFANGRLIGRIAGGWQLGSIVTLSDGTPINVGQIGDPLNIGTPNVPDATGISPIPTNRTPDNFYNIAAFSFSDPTLAYRFGNTGRNLLLTPALQQWDFSATKNTRIRERHSFEFRFEAFNFLNHPNYNTPSVDVRTPATFGRITSARTMREMQIGLKYIF